MAKGWCGQGYGSGSWSMGGEGGVQLEGPYSRTPATHSKNYAPILKVGFPKPISLHSLIPLYTTEAQQKHNAKTTGVVGPALEPGHFLPLFTYKSVRHC